MYSHTELKSMVTTLPFSDSLGPL